MTATEMVQQNFEPTVADTMRRYGNFQDVCLASIAVSLKRIADASSRSVTLINSVSPITDSDELAVALAGAIKGAHLR
jgi:hypothetical protein